MICYDDTSMGDEPKFPSPHEARRKNENVRITPSEARTKVVVQRAEAPPESHDARDGKKPAAKLTPEEVRALLAVSEENRPNKLWKRGRTIVIPGIVITVVAHFVTAYWPIIVGALVVGGLVWIFGPWQPKQDEWGG